MQLKDRLRLRDIVGSLQLQKFQKKTNSKFQKY